MNRFIRVAAAAIFRDDELLVARRKPGGPAGGLWEFPGGKVGQDEMDEDALTREIMEELALEIEVGPRIHTNLYQYPDMTILLVCYHAVYLSGEIVLTDHEEYLWCLPDMLQDLDLAPADQPAAAHVQAFTRAIAEFTV